MESEYSSFLITRLYELQQFQKFTDVTLIVNELKFYCHKIVLAAASDVFATMFGVEMKEKSNGTVDLSELDVRDSAFSNFIKYLYTGSIDIAASNVEDMMIISNFFLVHKLRERCFSFLENILSPQNCLDIGILADKFGNEKLYQKSEKIICENFMSLFSLKAFTALDFLFLQSILSNDNLEVSNEDNVLMCCVDWLYHDVESRKESFLKLYNSCVRTKYLSSDRLEVLKTLEKDMAFQGSFFEAESSLLQEISPRSCLDTCPVVISTGGYDGNKCLMTSFIFSPDECKWSHMSPMKISRHDHGAVVINNLLIVVGGFNTIFGPLESVECFNPIRNQWFEMPSMLQKRKSHAVCIYDGKIYAAGGLDGNYNVLNSVEYFSENSQRWEHAPSMINGRYTHGLVGNEKLMFAIGGWKTNSCEFYDGIRWTAMVSMKSKRAGAACSIYNDKIYVYGGYSEECCLSSLEIFDMKQNSWLDGPSSKISRWRSGSTVIGNNIFIVGGRNSTWQYLDSVETYSIDENMWDEKQALPFKVMGLKCCSVDVPRIAMKGKK